jgi:hypothetical protein
MSEGDASATAIRERRRRRLTILLLAGIAAVAVPWLWSILARPPDISHLSSESRGALYARTLSDLELCTGPEGRMLGAHCDHQAEFILNFEECDGACKALAAKWRRATPTK